MNDYTIDSAWYPSHIRFKKNYKHEWYQYETSTKEEVRISFTGVKDITHEECLKHPITNKMLKQKDIFDWWVEFGFILDVRRIKCG